MIWYTSDAWNSTPLGNGYSGTIFDGSDMFAEWTTPVSQSSSYGHRAECADSWCCPPNAPKKQRKNQVTTDVTNVTTHLPRCLYCNPMLAAASMTAEHGAWQELQYITGIKQHCVHPYVTSIWFETYLGDQPWSSSRGLQLWVWIMSTSEKWNVSRH